MNNRSRFSLLCVLLLLFLPASAQSQRTVGVVWQLPENESTALRQLQQFREMGISVLKLKEIPPGKIWKEIEIQNISIIADLGIRFPTGSDFANSDSSFKKQIQSKAADFLAHPSVIGINLFQYGALPQPGFGEAIDSFFGNFKNLPPTRLFITDTKVHPQANLPAGSLLYDIRVKAGKQQFTTVPDDKTIGGYKYSPDKHLRSLLAPLKSIINQTENQPQKPFLFDSAWLLQMVEQYPQFKQTMRSLTSDANPVFPVPEEPLPSESQSPLPIILLLIVWGILAYHYHISPLYRKSLFRYFTGHRFFLDDIYQRHIRSAFPALMIMLQHALLFAATVFSVSTSFWSVLGLKSVIQHYPELFLLTNSRYDVCLIAFLLTIIFYLIAVFWLYISHKTIRSVTQILTLFAWPLQINFVIGTIALAVHISGGSMYVTAILAVFMFVVLLSAFAMTAIDAARFLNMGRLQYLVLTVGIYVILLATFSIWMLEYNEHFWEVMDLSLRLK